MRLALSLMLTFLAALVVACGGGGGGEATRPENWTTGKVVYPPDPAPAQPRNLSTVPTAEGQKYLRDRLAELDGFKDKEDFHFYGYSARGPYSAWGKAVLEKPPAAYSFDEGVVAGMFWQMGMEYHKSKGAETKYTRHVRAEIERLTATPAKPAPMNKD
ncbi:MAG: hypothetical protein C0501_04100 [Isosphaera sp.]|nr:hypothetical protein [Isosphaera sp.]